MSGDAGILLTGGIGSGKSTAAGLLAAGGAAVFSADAAARRVLEPDGSAFGSVAARWPEAIVAGRVDRARLAGIVFADSGALAELEAMTHPAVAEILRRAVDEARAPLVVVEVPLLRDPLDRGWPFVVVDAPVAVREARLRARGMDGGDARRRMAAQPSRAEWLEAASFVIDNSRDLEHLAEECQRLWRAVVGE